MLIVHVDGPWAWCPAIGGFIANIIIGGLSKSFGIVMKEFEEVFECPSALMTLAGGLIYTFMYMTSVLVYAASEKFGTRFVVAVGATGASVCVLGASFAPMVELWVVLIGGGLGVSLSCVYFSSFVIVGRCFDKYRGLAMGVSVAGISVGQIAFPTLVSYLIEEYTIRGATFIAGAVCLHFLLTAVMMPSTIRDSTTKAETDPIFPMDWILLLVFVGSKVFSDVGDIGLSIMYPAFGEEIGLNNDYIGYAIAVGGAVDLFSRLTIGWISDRKFVRRSFMLALAWVLDGVNAYGMSSVTTYPGFVACYGLFGVCSGTAMALMVVVLTDFVGVEHLSKAFAIMMVSMGVVIAPGQFGLGKIKDITGSYRWSMRAAGTICLIGVSCLLMEYPVRIFRKYRKRLPPVDEPNLEMSPMTDEKAEGGAVHTSIASIHVITNANVADMFKT